MHRACPHARRKVVAQDDATTYIECLECGQFFEMAELGAPEAADDSPETPEISETLSDA